MPHTGFVHLRVHSAYSLLEGAIKIPDLIDLCRRHVRQQPLFPVVQSSSRGGALFSIAYSHGGGRMQFRLGLLLGQTRMCVAVATFVATLLLSTAAWPQSSSNESEGLLDGRQFKAGIVRADAKPDGEKPPLEDKLVFSNGMFSSVVCKRYNFAEAPYWVRVEGDIVHFLAELTSPTDGKMVWTGTIRGDFLEGTMHWTKERWYWTIDTDTISTASLRVDRIQLLLPPTRIAYSTAKGSPRLFRPYLDIAWKLALLVGVLVAASMACDWVMGQLNSHLTPRTEPALHRLIMTSVLVYIILMMLPFVPGAEIGLGMMVMFGPKISLLVYGGTVLALVLSFLIGRLVPQHAIIEMLETVRLKRAGRLLRDLEALDSEARLQYLLRPSSSRILPFLLRHRFLALMVALNIPGNSLVGGGGGISLVGGFSRLFSLPKFVLAVAVAVSPIPLMVFITGQ